MSDTDKTFAGSMPEFYERHMVPMHFAAHAQCLATRLAGMRSGRVLELAAGTGALSRILARELPEAVEITATDLNQPMLDQARLQPGAERVRWQREDASSLSFPNGGFDAVLCQFGVMFFPDKPRAFNEAFRMLRPGGCFAFNLWDRIDRNPLPDIVQRTVAALFPDNPPGSNLVPFAYSDPAIVQADLTAAGFTEIELEQVSGFSETPSAHAMAVAYVQGGVLRNEVEAHGPGWLERVTEEVEAALTASFGTGPMKVPNQALLVTAFRPAT